MEISRRTMLAGATAAAATTLTGPVFAAWEESARYPDPRVQILDPSFARYRVVQASVERLRHNPVRLHQVQTHAL